MRKYVITLSLLLLSSNVWAGGDCNAGFGSPCSNNKTDIDLQVAKAKAQAASLSASKSGSELTIQGANIPDPAAMAPNPYAAPPTASCWIGAGVTAAISEFGIGVTGMEWDPICGLWLAAQQVGTGDGEGPNPQNEAATAAFCMTMRKANVQSVVCVDWKKDQTLMENLVSLDPNNRADVTFSGSGSTTWGR